MPTKTAGTPTAAAASPPRSGPSAIPAAWAVEWTPRTVPSRPSGAVSYWRAPSAGPESADAKPPANSRMGGTAGRVGGQQRHEDGDGHHVEDVRAGEQAEVAVPQVTERGVALGERDDERVPAGDPRAAGN